MFSKSICLSAGLFLGAIFPLAPAVHADTVTPLQAAQMSANLYLTGLEQSDPILIMAAAKLRKSLSLSETDRAPERDGDAGESDAQAPITWEQMLDAAEELSLGDETLLGLIEDIRVERSKGVATGQVYSITSIRAGGTDTYPPLPYTGGEYAEVYVEGQASTDLNLFVHDAKGRLVCSDTDISAIAYCGWRPAQTGGFTIIVMNQGGAASSYSLITN
ncbi:hypothetical protein [Thalassovita sp.]|jgi:hypothetical protein|uniref:hypothetical protein n=1 Tax=Thalassovita sp. TaxID=1979401 RepID=UPI003B5C36AB